MLLLLLAAAGCCWLLLACWWCAAASLLPCCWLLRRCCCYLLLPAGCGGAAAADGRALCGVLLLPSGSCWVSWLRDAAAACLPSCFPAVVCKRPVTLAALLLPTFPGAATRPPAWAASPSSPAPPLTGQPACLPACPCLLPCPACLPACARRPGPGPAAAAAATGPGPACSPPPACSIRLLLSGAGHAVPCHAALLPPPRGWRQPPAGSHATCSLPLAGATRRSCLCSPSLVIAGDDDAAPTGAPAPAGAGAPAPSPAFSRRRLI